MAAINLSLLYKILWQALAGILEVCSLTKKKKKPPTCQTYLGGGLLDISPDWKTSTILRGHTSISYYSRMMGMLLKISMSITLLSLKAVDLLISGQSDRECSLCKIKISQKETRHLKYLKLRSKSRGSNPKWNLFWSVSKSQFRRDWHTLTSAARRLLLIYGIDLRPHTLVSVQVVKMSVSKLPAACLRTHSLLVRINRSFISECVRMCVWVHVRQV